MTTIRIQAATADAAAAAAAATAVAAAAAAALTARPQLILTGIKIQTVLQAQIQKQLESMRLAVRTASLM